MLELSSVFLHWRRKSKTGRSLNALTRQPITCCYSEKSTEAKSSGLVVDFILEIILLGIKIM